MKYIINDIKMSIMEEPEMLSWNVAAKIKVKEADIISCKILKESIDARRKGNINLVYSVLVETDKEINTENNVRKVENKKIERLVCGKNVLKTRPVVVGCGPSGIFTALLLARYGYKPIVIDRGESVKNRVAKVKEYWKTGKLDSESNVQFGEGGAGTFSDGKLMTRINDENCEIVLEEFYKSGAPEEILYNSKPHIGTDKLRKVVAGLTEQIKQLGGEVLFNKKLIELKTKNNKVTGVVLNDGEIIDTEIVVLALGHSARDTFESILKSGLTIIQKSFSIGLRIEHPQELINKAQYGPSYQHPRLKPAEYQLFKKNNDRTTYSFCMCPGGTVVASASEENTIVTNGMSEFSRDKYNANSAIVVTVGSGDFMSENPLAGIDYQRTWEKKAFEITNGKGAPVQILKDFINNEPTKKIGCVKPSYTGNYFLANLRLCLPKFVSDEIAKSIGYFDSKVRGFALEDAVLTGVETRTSSPIRILRDESHQAVGHTGIYPVGEGAGYSGGIMSSSVDGIKTAKNIIKKYSPML